MFVKSIVNLPDTHGNQLCRLFCSILVVTILKSLKTHNDQIEFVVHLKTISYLFYWTYRDLNECRITPIQWFRVCKLFILKTFILVRN